MLAGVLFFAGYMAMLIGTAGIGIIIASFGLVSSFSSFTQGVLSYAEDVARVSLCHNTEEQEVSFGNNNNRRIKYIKQDIRILFIRRLQKHVMNNCVEL